MESTPAPPAIRTAVLPPHLQEDGVLATTVDGDGNVGQISFVDDDGVTALTTIDGTTSDRTGDGDDVTTCVTGDGAGSSQACDVDGVLATLAADNGFSVNRGDSDGVSAAAIGRAVAIDEAAGSSDSNQGDGVEPPPPRMPAPV